MSEAAWNKAFTQGSRDLQNRLMKVHAKNPKFQAWLKSSGHGAGTSVKQASKEVKPSARVKSLQTKSLQAYGATKGAKVGGEHGSDDVRDTIAPLTRDQHSKVQAAERAAKAAAAKAAPKVKKPLTQAQRMAAIAAAVRKGKAKHDVATVDPDDMGHDDLMDVHQSLHVSRGYNEEVELEEGVATAQKVMDRANVVAKTNPDPKKRMAASGLARKAMLRTINPTGVNTGIVRGGGNKTYRMLGKIPPYQLTKKTGVSEEVEQIEEGFNKSSPAHMKARDLVSRSSMKAVYHSDGSATIHTTGDENVSSATKVDHIHRDAGLDHNKPASAYKNSSKSKGGLTFKTKETDSSHQVHISYKGMKEEVEQIDEIKISDVIKATRGKSPEEKQKIIQQMRDKENASKPKTAPRKLEPPKDIPMHQRVYPDDMKYHGDSVELEGPVMNEGAKEDAAKMLGGPVKTKPTNAPAGKLPYGFRRARNLARQAMKAGKPVTESTTEVSEVNEMNHGKKLAKMIMAKQSQHPVAQNMGEENIVEQDDTMEKKEMAQTQLHFMAYAAKEILEFIDMGGEIEEWYQNKLSKVQSEVESLHSYIEGEKRRTGMVKEEEQIDEISEPYGTKKLRRQMAIDDRMAARAAAHPFVEPEWLTKEKEKQAAQAAEKAKVKKEEVEQVDEKAPPGAKYERMVKHIKKGYAKGGLTPKEKSIAYATAWKAYGKKEEVEATEETLDEKYMGFKAVMVAAKKGGARDPAAVAAAIGRKKYGKEKFQAMAALGKKKANEETEVVAEAEGKVAVTPKEKDLAAHHGDPTRITYGDVIKARLKSAAAKKMGKK